MFEVIVLFALQGDKEFGMERFDLEMGKQSTV